MSASTSCDAPSYSRYKNHGCRCDGCRSATAAYQLEYTHRTGRHRPRSVYLAELRADPPAHGTEARYGRHGCRCESCRAVASAARRRRRAETRGSAPNAA